VNFTVFSVEDGIIDHARTATTTTATTATAAIM